MTLDFSRHEEFAEIREGVRRLCAGFPGEYWRKLDQKRAYPTEFVAALTEAGYLSVLIPEEYGGSGLSLSAAAAVLDTIHAEGCNGGACHAQMYTMGTILRHGSEEQKRTYLPKISTGAAIRKNKGRLANAALDLGMARSNLIRFAHNHSKVAHAVKDAREMRVDEAEEAADDLVKDRYWPAVQYVLSTLGKDRGYVLPKGTSLNGGDMTNTVVIGAVNIMAVPADRYVSRDGDGDFKVIEGKADPED